MKKRTVEITNETGLHTRPGNKFVKLAKSFESEILVSNESGKEVKGTSLLKLLSLGMKKGSLITIVANGKDEDKAVEELTDLLGNLTD
ncbi:HPr family phosphocarrier protein [Haliovirga abyssi]|uniref:Phosphocarrier protein HPr n=1 Tax=Haliovirga abyssi TaxID=2996794 RepID=A0AAU9DW18_9FUSO|nr:HPr family phosphocarrier protein [Haliovirga abyssi]BDU51579.1 phosphocarrier protein HPr [Haliovirga abyssi]